MNYNPEDRGAILRYAKNLVGKSLRDACDKSIVEHGYAGKGTFGQLLEKYYFQYEPNSESSPDFPKAGLELKSSPLKRLQNGTYKSKERLVLNIINYLEIARQEFNTGSFWKKNARLLLVFYLAETDTDTLDLLIEIADEWQFPETDLAQIKRDWELIKHKVSDGKAHELSEGDTLYLAACTKGSMGGNPRPQPNSPILAKQRAFSLKQKYVNHIIYSLAKSGDDSYGRLITSPSILQNQSLEALVISKFEPFYGKNIEEIQAEVGPALNRNAKSFYANLAKIILGISPDKKIEEFDKAEVIMKTVRLKPSGMPKEDISFPAFKYEEIVREDWEESAFKNVLETKFFFVFFQYQNGHLFLRKVKFWNMPFADIEEAKKVWEQTRLVVASGDVVRKVREGEKRRATNFPNKSFNKVSHVRPHAKNAADTFSLPIKDKITGVKNYTKHCFWLNNTYIKDEIFLK